MNGKCDTGSTVSKLTLARMSGALKKRVYLLRVAIHAEREFLRLEWKLSKTWTLGFRYRAWCWWRGFHTYRAPLYRLDDPVDGPLYITDREVYRNGDLDAPLHYSLNDKLSFWALVRTQTTHMAPALGLISRGRFFPLEGSGPVVPVADAVAGWRGNLYLKPWMGSSGVDTEYLQCGDRALLRNHVPSTPGDIAAAVGLRVYLVTPEIQQATYSRAVQPATSNTVRLLTVFDTETDRAHVVAAAQNFGRGGGPTPVDHWYRTGAVCDVDLQTGVLGYGVLFPTDKVRRDVEVHPETGAQMRGLAVPHWEEIRNEIERVATAVGFLPYIGWDVLVTDDSFFILEGNARSALGLLQLERPLLANPHVRQLLKRRGRLPKRVRSTTVAWNG